MSLSSASQETHLASSEHVISLRSPISATPLIVTDAASFDNDRAEDVGRYPASGIISYAQNREDVLLWRALHDLPAGFYIDVGAEDPTKDSVTRAFYERGWRGINIEPVQCHFDKLRDQRPRDLTLQVALGDQVGWITLYEIPDTGLSTLVKEVAFRHHLQGLSYVERRVPITTLSTLWEDFVKGDVHFLKIDVEGYEAEVLSGIALARYRPWIILLEATEPRSFEETWYQWEDRILESQYEFVHFDGLNRWYLAAERSHLKNRFDAPPNVFDRFELATTASVCHRLGAAEHQLSSTEHQLAAAKHQLEQIRESASWRWTAPLRAVRDVFCSLVARLRKRFSS
jgi:FkbM family methyltransferase